MTKKIGKKKVSVEKTTEETKESVFARILNEDADKQQKEAKKKEVDWTQIHGLVEEATKIETSLETLEEKLKEKKTRYKQITEQELPDKMTEFQLETFTTEDGLSVEVDSGVAGSITNKTRDQALQWLRENGHDDIIKNALTAWFGKGEDGKRKQLVKAAEKLEIQYEVKESVHPQTLKAFIKECRRDGIGLPQDAFNLYDYKVCKIKRPKK